MRFWNVDPFKDSARVFSSDEAVLTGADGSIHPSPVPREPGAEKTFRDEERRPVEDAGEKEDASSARRRTAPRARESCFMVVCSLENEMMEESGGTSYYLTLYRCTDVVLLFA